MGLAASQARFLAVTARKTNCEFQSMQIAQNKLSVTRELAQATQDYQNSLNATKLVWDYDCDNTGYLAAPCENATSLAFNTLMTPSIYNNYQPYLITTRTGAIVLNSKYAAAANAAGIGEGVGGQTRSQTGFYKFLDALVDNGLLPETTKNVMDGTTKDENGNPVFQFVVYNGKMAEDGGTSYVYDHVLDSSNDEDKKIIEDNRLVTVPKYDEHGNVINDNGYIVGYDMNAGFGSTPLSKNSMIASDLLGLSIKLDNTDIFPSEFAFISDDNITAANAHKIAINGALVDTETAKEISIGDLLTSDVTIIYTYPDNSDAFNTKNPDIGDIKDNIANDDNKNKVPLLFDTPINSILEALKANTAYSEDVLNYAVNTTKQLFSANAMIGEAVDAHDTAGAVNKVINQSNNYNSIYAATTKGNKDNCSIAYSLSNVLACILTIADKYTNGGDSKYNISSKVSDSNYVTMDANYSYPINSSNSTTQDMLLLTDFYMQLYNNICINGWSKSESVENEYYLNQLIKNGTYFISTIGDDGYFYQGRYNDVDRLIEVKDEDAIARAELEFQRIKATLTYKEDKLDLDMKNLDAEISSLTTELDSVKNLISKSIEKTFTMFQ